MLVGIIGCKGDMTGQSVLETTEIMKSLGQKVPARDLEIKRLDALNSFVFNVDTPAQLVEVYSRYSLRREPLDTLHRIQDAYMQASEQELELLASRFLKAKDLQVFIVGDKTTKLMKEGNRVITLEEDLKALAEELVLPYVEMALR